MGEYIKTFLPFLVIDDFLLNEAFLPTFERTKQFENVDRSMYNISAPNSTMFV